MHDGDLGGTNLIFHDIPLLDDVPVRQRYRRIPPSEYEVVKAHINQLLEAQVIRESCSPYASPIVLVKKKDGSLRMCVDYRHLNSKTRKDAFPLPRIEETLDSLAGARWFSTMDLASGYNQVPVTEADRSKTAFCTPFGLFEWNRMPFGLCNVPTGAHKCIVYTDNNPLSYLTSVKLGAMEQCWAAQLAAFDFELKYRSGKSNRNADAFSRQNLPVAEGQDLCLGAALPVVLRQAAQGGLTTRVNQIASFPCCPTSDMCIQQEADSVIGELLVFWRRKSPPSSEERKRLSRSAVILFRQWDRLVENEGVLYRRVFRPDGGEEVLQVLLPAAMKSEVLTQLHQQHGHQGVERTTRLYSSDVIGRGCPRTLPAGARSVRGASVLRVISPPMLVSWDICWLHGQMRF